MDHVDFDNERNSIVENWLMCNVSDNFMRDIMGLFHYDGIDYPKSKRSAAL